MMSRKCFGKIFTEKRKRGRKSSLFFEEKICESGIDLRVDLFLVFGDLVVVAAVVHFLRDVPDAAHTVTFGDVQSVQDRYGIMTEFVRRYGRIYSDFLFRRDKVTGKVLS